MKRRRAPSEYEKAFNEVLSRVQQRLKASQPGVLPVRMYVAGGAALHLLTGERVTEDIDATFSKKVLLGEDVEVSYRDPDGRARLLYLDRNYNALGLLHEDAYRDAKPVEVPGVDRRLMEVRVLSAVDLAVSKLARFTDQDRADFELLARRGLVDSESVRKRAQQALEAYVGDTAPVRASLDVVCRLIDSLGRRGRRPSPAR